MSNNSQNYKGNRAKSQQTVLEIIIIGFFKALWWLVRLPFKGVKFGVSKAGLSLDDRNYLVTKRQKIESMLNSDSEIELKQALMEADKLVDHALKLQGYQGETFADRLRSAEKNIDRNLYNQLWQGHKIRNQIAHEQETRSSQEELRDAGKELLNYLKTI